MLGTLNPLNVFAIFGKQKSFQSNPVIGSTILNRLGLHVGRIVLARSLTRFRLFLSSFMVDREFAKAFNRDGYVVLEDFLPPAEFDALRNEVMDFGDDVENATTVEGDTLTKRIMLTPENTDGTSAIQKLIFSNYRYLSLLKYATSHMTRPKFYIEELNHGVVANAEKDPQKDLHSDTFHDTMKAFYFITDVTAEDGPFTIIPGSHRVTKRRLKWEYRKSCAWRAEQDPENRHGSLRASDADKQELQLAAELRLTVPANTLVVANTRAFHRRGQAVPGHRRVMVWATFRANPFVPVSVPEIPGLYLLRSKIRKQFIEKGLWKPKITYTARAKEIRDGARNA